METIITMDSNKWNKTVSINAIGLTRCFIMKLSHKNTSEVIESGRFDRDFFVLFDLFILPSTQTDDIFASATTVYNSKKMLKLYCLSLLTGIHDIDRILDQLDYNFQTDISINYIK